MTRQRTWTPPRPTVLLSMARDDKYCLVRSGDELLDVVIRSLARLQVRLHGETPEVTSLWSELPTNVCRPKDQDSFSDWVELHLEEGLRRSGIVVNREVRIHRGERTDIHVAAVACSQTSEAQDIITAIIEVKGRWNQYLNTAIGRSWLSGILGRTTASTVCVSSDGSTATRGIMKTTESNVLLI